MALAPRRLYRVHTANLREVSIGIRHIERQLRAALARADEHLSEALLKILLLLLGSWAECRLSKLLYEANGFDDAQRAAIRGERSQLEQWYAAVDVGFRRRYNLPRARLPHGLTARARHLYTELQAALTDDLRPIIEMRNTLAHGQWAFPLNAHIDAVNPEVQQIIRAENALSARFKMSILEALASSIHDLVSGPNAFERDFDNHFTRLENARRNLRTRAYNGWRQGLVDRYTRGRQRRNDAIRAQQVE